MLIGIDLSKYNIGWDPKKAVKPIGFAIQRASWATVKDEKFDVIYEGVKQIEIRGAYHYYSSNIPWKTQADLFLSVAANKGFRFFVVDYERAFNNLDRRTIAEVTEFVKYVKLKTGKRCMIYFSPDIFKTNILPCGYAKWTNEQDVWIAQYPYSIGEVPLAILPALPIGLNTWKIWQYGGGDVANTAGRHAGANYGGGLVGMDLNYFNGSREEMLAWIGNEPVPPIVTIPSEPVLTVPVITQPIPTSETHMGWLKPRYVKSGPAIIAGSDMPRPNHPNIPVDKNVQNFIKSLSDDDVWPIFADEFVGPSKGIDPVSGKLKYIQAGWSGNVVKIIGQSDDWVKVECIDLSKKLPSPVDVNHVSTPHLVHRMTTVNVRDEFISYPSKGSRTSPWDRLNDPLLSSNGEFWLPRIWVEQSATLTVGLNVRNGPGESYDVVGGMQKGASIRVYEIKRDIRGNKWAKLMYAKWVCIEYLGKPYINWRLF